MYHVLVNPPVASPKPFSDLPPYVSSNFELCEPEHQGIPTRKPYVSRLDCLTIALCLICLILSIVSIWPHDVAVFLGQGRQLIGVGLLLSLMGLCTQRQIQLLCLTYEVHSETSTIQDLDALLRNSKLKAWLWM